MADVYAELPEELIQHIQSFLDPREAVRTSVLSKLWYSAWSTRPVLYFNYSYFHSTLTEFLKFTRRSIDRYQKLNLKLNSFKLSMYRGLDDKSIRLFVDESILSALTLGVNDLDLRFCKYCKYNLPDKIFSSIYLKKLCIEGVKINLPQSNGKIRVLCSRLVSLELLCVCVTDGMMRDILLGCPLMEDLRVINCFGLKKINPSVIRCKLRTFYAHGQDKLIVEWVENNAPGLQQQFHNLIFLELRRVEVNELFFKFFSHRFPCLERFKLGDYRWSVIDIDIASNSLKYLSFDSIYGLRFAKDQVPNVRQQYHNLTSLELCDVEVDDLFFKFFSHRFPCLERLELLFCEVPVIDIASNSLRYLTLNQNNQLSVIKVQAPNIQNFRLVTEHVPSLSFLRTPNEWKSYLGFYRPDVIDNSWLLKIKDVLSELSPSRISLSIHMSRNYPVGSTSISGGIIQSNLIPRILPFVENLEIETQYRRILFDWLLFCRPKYITWIEKEAISNYVVLALAYNELKKHQHKICSNALPGGHGLQEVDMEHYDETLMEWRPVRQGTEEAARGGGKFRLRLIWTQKRPRSMLI